MRLVPVLEQTANSFEIATAAESFLGVVLFFIGAQIIGLDLSASTSEASMEVRRRPRYGVREVLECSGRERDNDRAQVKSERAETERREESGPRPAVAQEPRNDEEKDQDGERRGEFQ